MNRFARHANFLAPPSRSFAVIGDSGAHEKCGEAFWAEPAWAMGSRFRQKAFTDGLVHGIERAGELLARTYPRSPDDGRAGAPQAAEVD